MNRLWWTQIKAVVRLELKKTFLARRGIWIYVLAALPVLIFIAFAFAMSAQQSRMQHLARHGDKRITYSDLQAVKPGMTKDEVTTLLGKPPLRWTYTENRPIGPNTVANILHEHCSYSDGQNDLSIDIVDGKVDAINLQSIDNRGEDAIMFAGIFQFFFLRLVVFFGCLGIFMNLFRGEILDRSLHFYFLAPIRREVLMVGKFLAGLLATCTIFVTSEVLQTVAFLWHFNPGARDLYLYQNHGLAHAFAYIGVTILACVGYGSFFLVAGMLFRNPIPPAAVALIWEAINPFLPAVLKQVSVIYYLKALCPVDVPSSQGTPPLLALLVSTSEPVSVPLAILGLLTVALLALCVSGLQVRRMEINYTTE